MNKLQHLWVAATLYLMASAALATEYTQIPMGVKALFGAQDTVLALKNAEPLGNDDGGTVVVVRHPSGNGSQRNPCELIVLNNGGGRFVKSETSDKVVECTYNQAAKSAAVLGLDHNLTVNSTEITYFNELARGGTTYSFAWSKDKSAWHLQHVEATSVQNSDDGVVVYKSILDYPSSLPWISLTDFDPKVIREPIAKNRKTVE